MIKRYDPDTDSFVEVTQEYTDAQQMALNNLGMKNDLIKYISNLNVVKDLELIKSLYNSISPIRIE